MLPYYRNLGYADDEDQGQRFAPSTTLLANYLSRHTAYNASVEWRVTP